MRPTSIIPPAPQANGRTSFQGLDDPFTTKWMEAVTNLLQPLSLPPATPVLKNGGTITVNAPTIFLSVATSPVTGLILGKGTKDQQALTLIGTSANTVTLSTTNCSFGSAGAPIFGSAAGKAQAMSLIYSQANSVWYETSRTVR